MKLRYRTERYWKEKNGEVYPWLYLEKLVSIIDEDGTTERFVEQWFNDTDLYEEGDEEAFTVIKDMIKDADKIMYAAKELQMQLGLKRKCGSGKVVEQSVMKKQMNDVTDLDEEKALRRMKKWMPNEIEKDSFRIRKDDAMNYCFMMSPKMEFLDTHYGFYRLHVFSLANWAQALQSEYKYLTIEKKFQYVNKYALLNYDYQQKVNYLFNKLNYLIMRITTPSRTKKLGIEWRTISYTPDKP